MSEEEEGQPLKRPQFLMQPEFGFFKAPGLLVVVWRLPADVPDSWVMPDDLAWRRCISNMSLVSMN